MNKWYQKWHIDVAYSILATIISVYYSNRLFHEDHPISGFLVLFLGLASSMLGGMFLDSLGTKTEEPKEEPTKVRVEVQEPQDELYNESIKEVEAFLGER